MTNDVPDLIEAAEDILTIHPDLGTCESMTRIRAAIASEKALRKACVEQLVEFGIEILCENPTRFKAECRECLRSGSSTRFEHDDDCYLSSLLRRLEEK